MSLNIIKVLEGYMPVNTEQANLALKGIGFALTRRFQTSKDDAEKANFALLNTALKIKTYLEHISVVENPSRPGEPVI
jgi:hypothetical protein